MDPKSKRKAHAEKSRMTQPQEEFIGPEAQPSQPASPEPKSETPAIPSSPGQSEDVQERGTKRQ